MRCGSNLSSAPMMTEQASYFLAKSCVKAMQRSRGAGRLCQAATILNYGRILRLRVLDTGGFLIQVVFYEWEENYLLAVSVAVTEAVS